MSILPINLRFFLPALFLLIFFTFPNTIIAQSENSSTTAVPELTRAEVRTPRLHVSGAEKPVRLISLAIRTEIQSGFAESSLDMEFYNPNKRILEGELELPLIPGQEISGLALDINGELRRGVPVGKARGQEVFDEISRQKVDPALLEATRGNSYKLRVYPLPANGKRRAVIRIIEPLKAKNGVLNYRLPLAFADNIESISIEAEVVSPDGPVKAEAGKLNFQLEQSGAIYRGRAEQKNFTPEGWLEISLPASESLSTSITAARWQDKLYFSAAAHIPIANKTRVMPKTVTILWDASASGLKRNQAKEFALLDSYFKNFALGQVRLIVFRDKTEEAQNFTIKEGNWQELREAIHGLVYDGATNLNDWAASADCPEYLLFSDGISNYQGVSGSKSFSKISPEQRLFAINSASTADYAALRAMAAHGLLIDLAHESIELAEAKLLQEGAKVSIINSELAGAAEAVLGPDSTYLSAVDGQGGLIRLAGWAKRGSGLNKIPIQVHFPDGSFREITISLPAWDDSPEFTGEDAPLQARLWGRYTIAGLEADYKINKKTIARLGEQMGLVSRETSLIVLETAEDYARYDITPPASLQAQVEKLRSREKAYSGGEQKLNAEHLLSMWQEKVKWWESNFDQKPKKENDPLKIEIPSPEEDRNDNRHTQVSSDDTDQLANEMVPIATREEARNNITMPAPKISKKENMQAVAHSEIPYVGGNISPQIANNTSESPTSINSESMGISAANVGLELKPWISDAPYIARMKKVSDDELYAVYLDERPSYMSSSAFFFDVADRFFERGLKSLGLRVLSNLAEMELENRQILRMLAYRLMQAGELTTALFILEDVRELAPYEPQSLRDIATVKAALGQAQEAIDLLYETAQRQWSGRFGEINTIALSEMNALIATHGKKIQTKSIDSRLIKNLASDIRVVLSWDMDNTDMDLLITDPNGEVSYYGHPRSTIGGRMSRDCTQGYGPEEFMLKKAIPGTYQVEVKYFGHSQQTIAGEVSMLVTIYSKFGTAEQKEEQTTLRLKQSGIKLLVAEFSVEE